MIDIQDRATMDTPSAVPNRNDTNAHLVMWVACPPMAARDDLRAQCLAVLTAHWREPGFTVPNAAVYPWQWLWDSCFCAMVWADLGRPDRALRELDSALHHQDPGSGFVPHVVYWSDPEALATFWGRSGTSSITQPPMYGHAVAELMRRGVAVPDDLIERSRSGLRFLLERRRRSSGGLIQVVHPWETGADDSPRWDDLVPGRTLEAWKAMKGLLVTTIEFDPGGSPVLNDGCPIAPAGFSALVAFNAAELAVVTDDEVLASQAAELSEAVGSRWDPALVTWVDDGPTSSNSGRIRTLEALCGALVDPDRNHVAAALDSLLDPSAHGARFGPTGVHRAERCFDPGTYWRGPAWPQLSYLMWVAARRAGRHDVERDLGRSLIQAARINGLAEYWNPDTAAGGGAAPQSWTALAWTVATASAVSDRA